MFCSKCGQAISDDGRYCQNCGAVLGQETPQEESPIVQQSENEYKPEEAQVITSDKSVDPNGSQGMIALILGIVGLVLGAICSCGCSIVGGIIPFILSVLAVVFGYQAKQKSAAAGFKNEKAQAGMILGIVAIAVIIFFVVINILVFMGTSNIFEAFDDSYYPYSYYTSV